jgi:protein gp37
MAVRLKAMGMEKYKNGFELTVHASTLDIPLNWKKPRLIFVDSMSDLFHEKVSETFISRVFEVMRKAHWHQYQILTKRSERLSILNQKIDWPANVWMGVSIENQDYKYRIDHLRNTDAAVKFLSLEPLLGPIPELDLENIGWVIVGGESGPKARAIREEWVIEIRDQCLKADVPFFFKQWGGVHKKQNGRLLEGITWDQMPACANAA